MPVLLTKNLSESGEARSEVALFNESGELTVAGEVVANFLETADFSEVFEHPEAAPYVITVEDEADESISEDVLPGSVVLRLMDEDDLGSMFLHYLDLLGEQALAEDAPLEAKTKLAVFENALLKPLNERFQRGAFRKIRAQKGGAEMVNRMLGAMLQKGEIKRAKKSGGGYKGGDYMKGGRYGQAERKSVKQKRMRIRKTKAGKLRQAATRSRGARRRLASLAASVGMEESFLFGHGESFHGAAFQVGSKPDAEVEFTEAEMGELLKTYAEGYDGMVKAKGRRGVKLAEPTGTNESAESLTSLHEHTQVMPIGVASLSEGADIAGRVMGVLNGPKKAPLTEGAR